MFPFPAFASARTRSKKTLVPSRGEDGLDVPVEALEDDLADGLLLGDRRVLAEEGRDLARILGRTGKRAVRPGQAA